MTFIIKDLTFKITTVIISASELAVIGEKHTPDHSEPHESTHL